MLTEGDEKGCAEALGDRNGELEGSVDFTERRP
jgi:hypothetical protein